MAQQIDLVQPDQFVFKDDGTFPNSVLPVLIYRQTLKRHVQDPASVLEKQFAANDWTNSWRDGVYSFAHYHSTSHEVLGVYQGKAKLQLGGEHGGTFDVQAGDVIVIPAGVAHQNLGSDSEFGVLGAYPGGRQWDLLRGSAGERPRADHNIAALPLPEDDPLYGANGPLKKLWKSA
jgi:uncharacterized protein YjlB